MNQLPDAELMALIRSGDHSAFAVLLDRHTTKFFTLAAHSLGRHADAEDVVQSCFIKLWQNPVAWDPAKAKFTTWFYRVVVNACHDWRRKSQTVDHEELKESHYSHTKVASEEEGAVLRADEARQQQFLEIAIAALPSSQRDAINLAVYSGLPQKEVAEIMDISVKALESLLVRAKRSMHTTVAELLTAAQSNNLKSETLG